MGLFFFRVLFSSALFFGIAFAFFCFTEVIVIVLIFTVEFILEIVLAFTSYFLLFEPSESVVIVINHFEIVFIEVIFILLHPPRSFLLFVLFVFLLFLLLVLLAFFLPRLLVREVAPVDHGPVISGVP